MTPTTNDHHAAWDLDTMLVDREIEGDKVAARRRLRAEAQEREFYAALKADPEMLIELAEAAAAVAAGRKAPMPHAAKMRKAAERAAAQAV